MTQSVSDVGALAGRMLDRLRANAARRADIRSAPVYGEALRVAELLLGHADPPVSDPGACAELLRCAAVALAATRHSLSMAGPENRPTRHADGPAAEHMTALAECLVSMADTLDRNDQGGADADVVPLHRYRDLRI